ncbi:MAG TPA: helix-turn-helix transcriptional regulator [Roseiarcus sp.]|nr:helix-turn-helix transcriptional regulator [Roseiarcus sp.]
MITADQAIIARRLLGWSLMKLSSCCGVSDVTIERFEKGKKNRHGATLNLDAIQRALEVGGVEFRREQPTVRLAKAK